MARITAGLTTSHIPAMRGYPSIAEVNERPQAPGLRNAAMKGNPSDSVSIS